MTELSLVCLWVQYQYANYSANYLDWGKGTIRFQLINQRSDFSFALFSGGLENVTTIVLCKVQKKSCETKESL